MNRGKIWIWTCLAAWTYGLVWSFHHYEDDEYDYQLDYHRPRDRQIALQLQAKAVENQGMPTKTYYVNKQLTRQTPSLKAVFYYSVQFRVVRS